MPEGRVQKDFACRAPARSAFLFVFLHNIMIIRVTTYLLLPPFLHHQESLTISNTNHNITSRTYTRPIRYMKHNRKKKNEFRTGPLATYSQTQCLIIEIYRTFRIAPATANEIQRIY